MQKLIQGLHQFHAGTFRERREFFENLAHGQSPEVLLITCSDSRIVPQLITQTEPGELFIVRNAGNIVAPYSPAASGEAATIEYAVEALKIRDIIVCGHSHCGAMKAVLQPQSTERLPSVRRWLEHAAATGRIVHDHYQHLPDAQRLGAAVQENVLVQLENLRTHPSIASGLAAGALRLHGWVYKIESGEVFAFDPSQGQYLPISDARPASQTGRTGTMHTI
jgi:carbonic anhydrase